MERGCEDLVAYSALEVAEEFGLVGQVPLECIFDWVDDLVRDEGVEAACGTGEAGDLEGNATHILGPACATPEIGIVVWVAARRTAEVDAVFFHQGPDSRAEGGVCLVASGEIAFLAVYPGLENVPGNLKVDQVLDRRPQLPQSV